MKPTALLFALAAALAAPSPTPQLAQVHKVYFLQMTNGMDQYLASGLTAAGFLSVVTDPTQADAIFTDRLGPKPKPPVTAKPPAPKPPAAESDQQAPILATGEIQPAERPLSSFRRSKGTVFLVDVKSRAVLWSVYDRPQNATADELDRTAVRIVGRLKRDLKAK